VLGFWIEAAAFLLRWLHVVAAIAWIGESFYFVALDRGSSRMGAQGLTANVVGAWRRLLPQAEIPAGAGATAGGTALVEVEVLHHLVERLRALLALTYLASPALYLIDRNVAALIAAQASRGGVAFLSAGYLVYDIACRAGRFPRRPARRRWWR
jgi:uncharacterized membrane protein